MELRDPSPGAGPRIHNPWGRVLLAIGLQLVLSAFLATLMLAVAYLLRTFPDGVLPETLPQMPPPSEEDLAGLLRSPAMVFGYFLIPVITGIAVLLFGRGVIDRAPLAGLGLRLRELPGRRVLRGFLFGMGFAAAAILFISAAGGRHLRWELFAEQGGPGWAAPLLLVLALTALMEEWLIRGYILTNLRLRYEFPRAAFLSALAFTLLHVDYPGAGFLSWLNLFLAGMVLAQLREWTGGLAVPVAVHAGWNLALGGLFGVEVGGFAFPSLLRVGLLDLSEPLAGGTYGPEAALPVTLLLGGTALALGRLLNPPDEDEYR